jgi:energy-coupling factor transport system substrate-specific component
MSVSLARRAEAACFGLVGVLGLAAFGLPLWSAVPASTSLLLSLVVASAAVLVALALQARRLSPRLVAVLAALIAVDAALRLAAVIGLAGFSPIFLLILVTGYVFGPSLGFAMGALTLLLSAVFTAGFGPWVPYQMLGCGWVGAGAGAMGRAAGRRPSRRAMLLLAGWGAAAGFGYGMLLDLWQWPLFVGSGPSSISWAPSLPPADLLRRFGAFYVATSLVYDSFRAVGNAVLILLLGQPLVTALLRFQRRFLVEWESPVATMLGNGGNRPAGALRDLERGSEPARDRHPGPAANLAGDSARAAASNQTTP